MEILCFHLIMIVSLQKNSLGTEKCILTAIARVMSKEIDIHNVLEEFLIHDLNKYLECN